MLLSGMASTEQVDQNVSIADAALPKAMTPSQFETIARVVEVFERFNRVPCTGCNYCVEYCPEKIVIPYNASFAYGRWTGLSQYFTASAVRTASPKLVSNCIHCGKCARHCPQQIDIPARLEDVRHRLQPGPVDAALRVLARFRRDDAAE